MKEMIMEMADGDAIALSVLIRLTANEGQIHVLKNLGITGALLTKLYMVLCKKDMEKLKITIDLFDGETYLEEEIMSYLTSDNAYPFFDESIEEFSLSHFFFLFHVLEEHNNKTLK